MLWARMLVDCSIWFCSSFDPNAVRNTSKLPSHDNRKKPISRQESDPLPRVGKAIS